MQELPGRGLRRAQHDRRVAASRRPRGRRRVDHRGGESGAAVEDAAGSGVGAACVPRPGWRRSTTWPRGPGPTPSWTRCCCGCMWRPGVGGAGGWRCARATSTRPSARSGCGRRARPRGGSRRLLIPTFRGASGARVDRGQGEPDESETSRPWTSVRTADQGSRHSRRSRPPRRRRRGHRLRHTTITWKRLRIGLQRSDADALRCSSKIAMSGCSVGAFHEADLNGHVVVPAQRRGVPRARRARRRRPGSVPPTWSAGG